KQVRKRYLLAFASHQIATNHRRSPPTAPTDSPSETSTVPPPANLTCEVPRRPAPAGTGLPCCTTSSVFHPPAGAVASGAISGEGGESAGRPRAGEERMLAPPSSTQIIRFLTWTSARGRPRWGKYSLHTGNTFRPSARGPNVHPFDHSPAR